MAMPNLRFKADDGSAFPDWETTTVGNLFSVSAGGDLDKNRSTAIPIQSDSYPFPVYANSLEQNGLVGYASYYKVEGDTFTVTGRGNIGHATARHEKYVPIVRLLVCKPKQGDIVDFFAYQINSINFLEESTGVPQLTAPSLRQIKLKRPCIEEQRKIAECLGAIDEVIAKAKAEIEVWELRKKGVAQRLFSQEVRFKADDGSDFPNWVMMPLKTACYLNPKAKVAIVDEFYYMDLGNVEGGQWLDRQIVRKSEAPSRAKRVANLDDVFFQSVRPYNMGHYHYTLPQDKQVIASTGFIQARMRNGCNAFLYHLFFEDKFNEEVSTRCTGSNYPAINSTSFGEIETAFPSPTEQRKIAECLDAFDEVIAKAKAELELWRELKRGLLQQLFV